MTRVTGQTWIAATPERVFATVADTRNEPSFNPAMRSVDLLTEPPIGLGTRFRALMGSSAIEMLVEVTEFDRPRRLGSRATLALMETTGAITFVPERDGTRMSWDWQVRPKGWLRTVGPLMGPVASRAERRIWAGLKRHLEASG